MKLLSSDLRKFIGDLPNVTAQETAHILTMSGFMVNSLQEVSFCGQKDFLFDIEVRQNRADCLSVLGLARELAAYFGRPLTMPELNVATPAGRELSITVRDEAHVQRVLAVEIQGVKNITSPAWLSEWLALYDMNSVNLLVDISNYVMLVTGYPSHLLDLDKLTKGEITWELNRNFDSLTTLDGSEVVLQKDEELIIRDKNDLLALAGVVGGSKAAVDLSTQNIFAEVAVYRSATIRKNSEKLRIVTEASRRLEKDLDAEGSERAFTLLLSMILELAGGSITSQIFNYYPNPKQRSPIEFDPSAPGEYAGIPISRESGIQILKNLGFAVEILDGKVLATPPGGRTDIGISQDLVEEVIRITGYDKIPSDILPSLAPVTDITPRHLKVADMAKDLLAALGYDEALSLAMSKIGDNAETNYRPWEKITTLNSVNELFPELRQSLAGGMLNQLDTYLKRGVSYVRLFEIGKVFGKQGAEYQEHDALGLLLMIEKDALAQVRLDLERVIRNLGFTEITFHNARTVPSVANPHSCFDIHVEGQAVGIIYKLVPGRFAPVNTYFAEVDILQLSEMSRGRKINPVVELTEKLVALDANIELPREGSITDAVKRFSDRLPQDTVWSIEVVDAFPRDESIRYTVRVTYTKLSDQEAKEIHLKAFELAG